MEWAFLEEDTVKAAEQLIGCHLVRRTAEGVMRVRITETEAYRGGDDPASHAYRGRTARNEPMFGEVGRLYVYLIYGMHYCMNVVAHRPGEVGAVLLRAAEPLEGLELMRANRPGMPDRLLLNGPGKLAQALGIDGSRNGDDLIGDPEADLVLERHAYAGSIRQTPRIGITKATELLWRFIPAD